MATRKWLSTLKKDHNLASYVGALNITGKFNLARAPWWEGLFEYLIGIMRFRKLIRKEILFKLHKAYILPHFYYCSSVWHFCGARDADKLEALNKRILRFILGDYLSLYNTLLSKVSSTWLCNKRIQNFLILLYEFVFHSFSYLYEEYFFTMVLFL